MKNKILLILIPIVFFGCGSSKKLSENYQDKSKVEQEIVLKRDTSKIINLIDSLSVSTETTIREYQLIPFKDTVINHLAREITETNMVDNVTTKSESQKGETKTSEKNKEDRNIQIEKEEEREPYDPVWIRYLFWTLLLISVVGFLLWLKSKIS